MNKKTVRDIDLKGKRVVMRVDFNVPIQDGKVTDDTRIQKALPTIKYILENGASLVLLSHLGRPRGEVKPEFSLKPAAEQLEQLLNQKVKMPLNCIGEQVVQEASALKPGEIMVCENTRFHKEEDLKCKTEEDKEKQEAFAKELAKLGNVYVNDAFGTAHRAHASTEGVTHHFHQCAAGYLMMKELDYLGKVVENPVHPFVAILGGAKISGKIDVISNFLPKVEKIVIGGAMTYTFYKAQGLTIGKSLLESDKIDMARELLDQGANKIVLPVDCIVSDIFDFDARRVGELKEVGADAIPSNWFGLDIGSQSIEQCPYYIVTLDREILIIF